MWRWQPCRHRLPQRSCKPQEDIGGKAGGMATLAGGNTATEPRRQSVRERQPGTFIRQAMHVLRQNESPKSRLQSQRQRLCKLWEEWHMAVVCRSMPQQVTQSTQRQPKGPSQSQTGEKPDYATVVKSNCEVPWRCTDCMQPVYGQKLSKCPRGGGAMGSG